MSAVAVPAPVTPAVMPPPFPRRTAAELIRELGGVPAERVLVIPPPGTATEADAVAVNRTGARCELVNGTLVEKPMSVPESYLGVILIHYLTAFVFPANLGLVLMADAQFRMRHGNLRLPDVSFTRQRRLPNPLPQVGGWCPDLCIEVLSPSNTPAEMLLKRQEYFASGCELVWEFDPRARAVVVYTSAADPGTAADPAGPLAGGSVLPGFALPLADVFARYAALNPTP